VYSLLTQFVSCHWILHSTSVCYYVLLKLWEDSKPIHLTSVKSGSAVSNIIKSVRNVPKYGTVPWITPFKKEQYLVLITKLYLKYFLINEDSDDEPLQSAVMGWTSGRVDREFSHNNHIK